MSKRTYEEYIKNGCHPVGYNEPCQSYYFGQVSVDLLLDQIDQLKQQLEALMLEISKQEVEQHDLPDYCTRTGTDCTNLGKIEELQQQLAEKDKEIEKLKQRYTILENENGKLTTELIMGKYKKAQKEVSFGMQFAIQELEKVKNFVKNANGIIGFDWRIDRFKVIETIDNQIKALKGNNDEPRQSN